MTLRSGEVSISEPNGNFVIPESFSIFGLSVSFYGLCLVLAALIGIVVISHLSKKKNLNEERNLTLITVTIVSALAGARIYYAIFEWQIFVEEPLTLLNLRSGGFSYFGALLGAWSAVKFYCKRKNADFNQSADTLSIGAAAAAPVVWLGCAFSREPLGRLYDGLFPVSVGKEYMYPVAAYGIVLSILSFIVLCVCLYQRKQQGTAFTLYLILNAVMCLILEFFRADRSCIWGTEIPVNYVVAGVLLAVILYGRIRELYLEKKRKRIFL